MMHYTCGLSTRGKHGGLSVVAGIMVCHPLEST